MPPPAEAPCPLCGESVPRGARRCDNCGSVIPEKELEELSAFMESLRVDAGTAQKLYDSGFRPEPATPAPAKGGTLYLCPACGAFVNSADTKCAKCGADLAGEETAATPSAESRLCPHCGSTIHVAAEVCPACGKSAKAAPEAVPELCPECGSVAPTGRRTCAVCGTPLRGAKPKPAEAAVAPKAARPPSAPAKRAVAPRPAPKAAEPTAPARPEAPPPTPARKVEPAPKPEATAVVPRRVAKPPAARRVTPPRTVAPSSQRLPGPSNRLEAFREFTAVGAAIALPVALAAGSARVPGYEFGQLFLFGALFGLAAALTLPGLRTLGDRRMPALLGLAGTLLLAAAPVAGYMGPSGSLEALLLAAGVGLLGVAVWRRRTDLGVPLAWTAGLLLLTLLAAAPFTLTTPSATASAQWAVGAALALGSSLLLASRRWLRYAADARLLRADGEYARREYEKAVSSYDAAARLARRAGRENAACWYGKGAALVAMGKYEEALAALDRALALDPGNEVAWINKGTALSRLGRIQEALKCYNSAIKANPRYEVAWNNKGNALARLGKHDLALACYERALEIDRAYRTAWVNKGFVLAKLGRFEEAAEAADQALRLTTGVAAGR